MRITCPSCHALYEVNATLLHPGRTVRCVRCATLWHPQDPTETPAADAEPPTGTAAPDMPDPDMPDPDAAPPPPLRPDLAAPSRSRPAAVPQRKTGLALAWLGSLVLLVALAGAAWHWRATVMQNWPPSARLYAALGAK